MQQHDGVVRENLPNYLVLNLPKGTACQGFGGKVRDDVPLNDPHVVGAIAEDVLSEIASFDPDPRRQFVLRGPEITDWLDIIRHLLIKRYQSRGYEYGGLRVNEGVLTFSLGAAALQVEVSPSCDNAGKYIAITVTNV